MSLRRRVVLAGGVIAVVLIVADVALAGTFRSFLLGRLDQQLIEAATRVADAPGPPPRAGGDRPAGQSPPRSDNPAFSEYFIARADAAGNLVIQLGDPLSSRAAANPRPDPETGLGLAIVAGIAEAHGGTAQVESSPGTGTRFRLRLPLRPPPAQEPD